MREIEARQITETVARLFREANVSLPADVLAALKAARAAEVSPAARDALDRILENSAIAGAEGTPLCQDTGTAVVFLELGQDIHVAGGDLYAAVNDGVRQGYKEGYLRKSMVGRPYTARVNSGDNSPAVIYTDIVPGDKVRIIALPKGGGAENMSALKMLSPSEGRQGIIDFVVSTIDKAGSNPCPPVIVGVGIGGTADRALVLAKRALLRPVGEPSPDPETAELEREILRRVNDLGIGAMGYGGVVTALAVHVETMLAHIASLPVAVNPVCHSARHREATI
jgi:fumarate hydratase subunit alpha